MGAILSPSRGERGDRLACAVRGPPLAAPCARVLGRRPHRKRIAVVHLPGITHITPAGRVFVVHPDEPHTGEPASSVGYVYRTLYLEKTFLARASAELGNRAPRSTYLKGAVLADPVLARSPSALHRALERGRTKLEQELLLLQAVGILFTRYGDTGRACSSPLAGKEPGPVGTACDQMEAHFDRDVSLSALAQISTSGAADGAESAFAKPAASSPTSA